VDSKIKNPNEVFVDIVVVPAATAADLYVIILLQNMLL